MVKRNLLIITPDFPESTDTYVGGIFVKDFIDSIKSHFHEVVVVAPVLFSGKLMPNDRFCKDYHYDNVSVFYPRCFFLPRCLHLPGITNRSKLSFDTRPYIEAAGQTTGKKVRPDPCPLYVAVGLHRRDTEGRGRSLPITTVHEDPAWLLKRTL